MTSTAVDDGAIEIRIETRDGRLCCAGRAGLGTDVPWDRAADRQRGAGEVLPDLTIGRHQHDQFVDPAAKDSAQQSNLPISNRHGSVIRSLGGSDRDFLPDDSPSSCTR